MSKSAIERALDHAVEEIGGKARQGQIRMAKEIDSAMSDERHLLIQAGTGTGKSLGYLIPVMNACVCHGTKAVVSTATLALQRQILTKDAPLAARAIASVHGNEPKVSLLKGWNNYLCKHKMGGGYPSDEPTLFDAEEATSSKSSKVGKASTASLGEQVVRIRSWATTTETGDRDDLVPGVSDKAWAQVSVSKAECLGGKCPLKDECFAQLARNDCQDADVVVTNHALLGIAVAGNNHVLPDHDVLVVDEAHDLADRVRSQGSVSISAASVTRVAKTARRDADVLGEDLMQAGQELGLALAELEEGRLETISASLRAALASVEQAARQMHADIRAKVQADSSQSGALSVARTAVADLVDCVTRALSDSIPQCRDVAWIERPRGGVDPARLMIAPIEVAGAVANTLFNDHTAILTSATLALGGKFDVMARTVGMTLADASWTGLDVGSPFTYAKQGILYVASHLPAPSMGISDQALDEVVALAKASDGGMLGLFSSRQAAEDAAQVLRDETDLPVFCQGEDQLPSLVEEFAKDDRACLVGTVSLWQGVDVPGHTCRLVLIDRIPFPRPGEPVASARMEKVRSVGGNPFMTVAATHAALLMAQGAGRLIRRTDDRGVVAVLDSRLVSARYGSFLVDSMPPLWRTTDRDTVLGALERLSQP
ncbi:ATP-dependent DNA helicase [Actinomyces vulturis]|uniref:ATP-dependent DNA helicase n=1 Tax=Actinomyces vulturis TaxID=1857645 RepID=UPI00082FBDBE|nr:ATP-dependent DNA helicase [Actinomyces vulturis]